MESVTSMVTIGRTAFALCLAALVSWRCGAWAASVAVVPLQQPGDATLEQRALLRGILRRIDDGEHVAMRRYFPEGGLFSLSFTGFALAAHAHASDSEVLRADARARILDLLARSDDEANVDPFASWGKDPWRGVIFEGHRNLLRAAYVQLGGKDARVIAEYQRETADLARRFLAARSGNLESFPHQVWPVDNVVALESLRLHDAHFGKSDATRAIEHWRHAMRARIDKKTGMFVSEIDVAGSKVRDGPRGCALSWMFAFLPALDADLSRSMWRTYRGEWSVWIDGMVGFREWPPGVNGHVDADTGPIVLGIGGAASAFGVAAAHANGDPNYFQRMLLPLEILTAPSFTWRGEKELFGGHMLLADVLSVWGKTWQPLDAEPMRIEGEDRMHPSLLSARMLALTFLGAPIALAVRWAISTWRRRRPAYGSRNVVFAHVAVLLVALALDLSLVVALVTWWIVDAIDRWTVKK
jgi:hypothetical protein